MDSLKIPKRILSSLISSLSAGVVPRSGAPYVAIGREKEITALLSDLNNVEEGGAAMRFIIGRYGSGKSFLIQLMRGYSLERGFVTCDCDLSPERRLCSGKGNGVATYRELVRNMAVRTCPDGGALSSVISKWLSGLQSEAVADGILPESPDFEAAVRKKVFAVLSGLENNVGGFDFSLVLSKYYNAEVSGNDEIKSSCLRWLRGEYTTKTEARQALSVGCIIDDENWFDYIKLWAEFVRLAGYKGLVLFIDECVNLFKITNRIGRENNYEKLLSMFNDTLQGRAKGLDIIFGGTPEFLEDRRRGLFSYEALRSRLADGRFSEGYTDMLSPVIRLRPLSGNELLALIRRVTVLHGQYYSWKPRAEDVDMVSFLNEVTSRVGSDTMVTPREIIRDYLSVLNLLLQNPEAQFGKIIGSTLDNGSVAEVKAQKEDDVFSLDDIEI